MTRKTLSDRLFSQKTGLMYLSLASLLLIFALLGTREIWTQEHRWADIVFGMFYRHDFLHPYLGEVRYYDKPLLSYWLIAAIAQVTGTLSTWALRLPSALAGVLAIFSMYSLGGTLKDKRFGLLSAWMLLTTFYFLFWARTSSADMLNLGGILLAIAWYMHKRHKATFLDYAIFFLIISITSLCKGLTGAIVPLIAVFVDICLQKSWRQHLSFKLLLAAIPAMIIYFLPFWASTYFGGQSYGESGLYLVYRENILRYFQPFDHQGPIYTYFIYLPIYLLPWTLFFIPALFTIFSRWKKFNLNSKWIAWTLLAVFTFYTLSGSRRSYYVLPMVPFAILLTADWILASTAHAKRVIYSAAMVVGAYVILLLGVDLVPAWYYSQFGVERFATTLQTEATAIKPWAQWNVVMLDAESKLRFYLELAPQVPNEHVNGKREEQTSASLLAVWPILNKLPPNTIFISRSQYESILKPYFVNYEIVKLPAATQIPFLRQHDLNAPIAFIPKQ